MKKIQLTILFTIFCLGLAIAVPQWQVTIQGSKNTDYYKSISVIDDNTIFVLSNTSKVYKTVDAGATWSITALPAWPGQPRSMSFGSANVGYVAGDNGVAKTIDGGATWTLLTAIPTGTLSLSSAHAINENTCYFGGSGKVYYTNDGGSSFNYTTVGSGASSIYVTPNGTIFRAGASGGIYKSVDGATTFSGNINTKTSLINNVIPGIYFSDNNTGYAVGLYKTASPYVNRIIKTTDGGTTWNAYDLGNISTDLAKGANAVCIPSGGEGYVVGAVSNSTNDIYIKKTIDGGATFSTDTVGAKLTDYYNVAITPKGDVYVAGNGYVLVRKIDEACSVIFSPTDGILPDATLGMQYNATISQTGYSNPAFSAINLPDGLNLSATGVISGIPTTKGTTNITLTLIEGDCSVQKSFTLKVWEPYNETIIDFDYISREFSAYLCTYSGNVDNPKQNTTNPGIKVGSVLTGITISDAISIKDTLRFIDFVSKPIIEVKVLAPYSGILRMRLGKWGSSGVYKDLDIVVPQNDNWQTVRFDYTGNISTLYNKLSLFFDYNSNKEGTWYFDDIKQVEKHAPNEFRLVDQLQSNMVIQQAKPFKIWGRGVVGETVTISTDFTSTPVVTTIAADNTWLTQIDVPAAIPGDFNKHQITVSNSQKTITLSNLLIGDVWFCSGQSNMAMTMTPNKPWHNGVIDHENEIAAANFPNIRLWETQAIYNKTPAAEAVGSWNECSPATVSQFSAVAYYFGQKLHQELNIPIGLVLSARGATPCQAYIERSYLENDEIYKTKYLDPYDALIAQGGDSTGLNNPILMYNSLVNPFINLSIKGYIWYQGENNAGDRGAYTRLNELMIRCWRDKFNQGDLPFYLVQMTPHTWGGTNYLNDGYAYFREAQEKILETPNTGMAVTMDVGELNQIHPSNKKPVGQRLAAWALARTYDKTVQYKGPWFNSIETNNDTINVNFDPESLGGGMITSNDSMPRFFYLSAADKLFYPAYAAIVGNKIKLFSPKVTGPIAVRYAFHTYSITNLQNTNGFPAVPFRTDNWDYNSGQTYMTDELDESLNPFNNQINTGISETSVSKYELSIVPGLSGKSIELRCPNQKIETVMIFDMKGALRYNHTFDDSLIDIQNFATGLYLVSATLQNKSTISNRFIKQ